MGTAWAAAENAAHSTAFYESPTFWVLIAFVLFWGLFGKKIFGAVNSGLDARAEKIRDQIDEATKLREEAQELLATYTRKQQEAAREAEAIVERAKVEAQRLQEKAAEDLEASLKRREQQAMDRIAQAEAQAMKDVKNAAIEVAVSATEKLLSDTLSDAKADELIADAIKEIPGKLH